MSTMICAVCKGGFTALEAEMGVATDAGPVHARCFDGPAAEGSAGDLINDAEEEAAREAHNDVPLPPVPNVPLTPEEATAMFEATDSARLGRELDTYDKSERLVDEMESVERQMGGRYDEDGMGY